MATRKDLVQFIKHFLEIQRTIVVENLYPSEGEHINVRHKTKIEGWKNCNPHTHCLFVALVLL